jgi:hypothetical protein
MPAKAREAFSFLVLLSFPLAAASAAALSFFGPASGSLAARTAAAVLAGSCLLSFFLVAAYLWVCPSAPRASLRFLLGHGPLAVLGICAALSLAASTKAELSLAEGESLGIGELYARLGIEAPASGTIELLRLEAISAKTGGRTEYRSILRLREGTGSQERVLEVNRPITLGELSLYQAGWTLGVRRIDFAYRGESYFFRQGISLPAPGGESLMVEALGDEGRLAYRWRIEAGDGSTVLEGIGTAAEAARGLSAYGFSIVKEDYARISLIEARRKPFEGILAAAAIAYLGSLAAYLLLRSGSRAGKDSA